MKRGVRILSLVVLVGAGAVWVFSLLHREEWPVYQNSRYSFSLEYPSGWVLGEPPGNNDGRTFFPADQSVECHAYGFHNSLVNDQGEPQTLAEFVEWIAEGGGVIEEEPAEMAGSSAARVILRREDGKIQEAVYILNEEEGRGVACVFEDERARKGFEKNFTRMVRSFTTSSSIVFSGEECTILLSGAIEPLADLPRFFFGRG